MIPGIGGECIGICRSSARTVHPNIVSIIRNYRPINVAIGTTTNIFTKNNIIILPEGDRIHPSRHTPLIAQEFFTGVV